MLVLLHYLKASLWINVVVEVVVNNLVMRVKRVERVWHCRRSMWSRVLAYFISHWAYIVGYHQPLKNTQCHGIEQKYAQYAKLTVTFQRYTVILTPTTSTAVRQEVAR